MSASLSERVTRLTSRNNSDEAAPAPPAISTVSPFHEILIAEVAAVLPRELANRLRASVSLDNVNDWIAAGAIYRSLPPDSHLRRYFLREVSADPASAGLALARSYASLMEPPPRDTLWHRCDRIGLGLQLILVASVLAGRGLFVTLWVRYLAGTDAVLWKSMLANAFPGAAIFRDVPEGAPQLVLRSFLAIWLFAELVLVPGAMESLRQLPARVRGLPPPLSWRADTFPIVWILQDLAFLAVLFFQKYSAIPS